MLPLFPRVPRKRHVCDVCCRLPGSLQANRSLTKRLAHARQAHAFHRRGAVVNSMNSAAEMALYGSTARTADGGEFHHYVH